MYLTKFIARNVCVVTKMDTGLKQGVRRQTLFSTVYSKYLRRAIAGVLKVASEAMKNVHAAESDSNATTDEEEKLVTENTEIVATVELWVLSAEKTYLAVQKTTF